MTGFVLEELELLDELELEEAGGVEGAVLAGGIEVGTEVEALDELEEELEEVDELDELAVL